MENAQILAAEYIAVMGWMVEIIATTLNISAITLLNIFKDKIDIKLFYIFQLILWLLLLNCLWYLGYGLLLLLK